MGFFFSVIFWVFVSIMESMLYGFQWWIIGEITTFVDKRGRYYLSDIGIVGIGPDFLWFRLTWRYYSSVGIGFAKLAFGDWFCVATWYWCLNWVLGAVFVLCFFPVFMNFFSSKFGFGLCIDICHLAFCCSWRLHEVMEFEFHLLSCDCWPNNELCYFFAVQSVNSNDLSLLMITCFNDSVCCFLFWLMARFTIVDILMLNQVLNEWNEKKGLASGDL